NDRLVTRWLAVLGMLCAAALSGADASESAKKSLDERGLGVIPPVAARPSPKPPAVAEGGRIEVYTPTSGNLSAIERIMGSRISFNGKEWPYEKLLGIPRETVVDMYQSHWVTSKAEM